MSYAYLFKYIIIGDTGTYEIHKIDFFFIFFVGSILSHYQLKVLFLIFVILPTKLSIKLYHRHEWHPMERKGKSCVVYPFRKSLSRLHFHYSCGWFANGRVRFFLSLQIHIFCQCSSAIDFEWMKVDYRHSSNMLHWLCLILLQYR